MAKKPEKTFVCQSCGTVYPKWMGRCEACGEWNTIVEEQISASQSPTGLNHPGKTIKLSGLEGSSTPPPRKPTGIAELDRVLGGGLVQASVSLVGGDPGIGKSTLLLQAACSLADKGFRVLYISG